MVADGAVVLSRLYSRWQRWSRRRFLRVAISLWAALHVSQPNWLRVCRYSWLIFEIFARCCVSHSSNLEPSFDLIDWLKSVAGSTLGRPGRGQALQIVARPPNFAVLLTYCGQLIPRKISKSDVTRCQILGLIWSRWNKSADCATGFFIGLVFTHIESWRPADVRRFCGSITWLYRLICWTTASFLSSCGFVSKIVPICI